MSRLQIWRLQCPSKACLPVIEGHDRICPTKKNSVSWSARRKWNEAELCTLTMEGQPQNFSLPGFSMGCGSLEDLDGWQVTVDLGRWSSGSRGFGFTVWLLYPRATFSISGSFIPLTHYALPTSHSAHSRVSTMMKTMLSIMTIPKLELKVKYWFESVQRYTERTDLNGQVTDWKFRSLLANYNSNLMLHSSFTGCSSLVLMWNGGFCIVGWSNFFCMATLVISACWMVDFV